VSKPFKQKTRVAFFVSTMEGGGAERVMLNLVNHYAEQGYKVDLLLAKKIGPYLDEVSSKVRIVDLNVDRAWQYIAPLVRYFRSEKPEVMLVATTILNVIALFTKRLSFSRTRVVVSEHIDIVSFAETGLLQRSKLVRWGVRMFYPQANNVVAVSEGAADRLSEFSGLKRTDISTVYNGVVDDEKLALSRVPVDNELLNNKDIKVLLAVGRLQPQKDYANLLHSFGLLLEKYRSVSSEPLPHLMVLGEGELRPELESLADELGIRQNLSMPGFVDNPFQYLANTDVFILSSEFEGLPTVLIEALACGCSVVSTDCPSGPDEILKSGQFGRLVPIKDSQALADSLFKTLTEGDVCSQEERLARGLSFNVDAAVEKYSRVLGLTE